MIERMVLLIVGLTVFSLTCLWQQLQNRQLQYQITDVQEQVEEARRKQKRLRIDVEKLRSPERLEKFQNQESMELTAGKTSEDRVLSPGDFRDLVRTKRHYAGVQ